MDPKLLAIVALRSLSTLFTLAGKPKQGEAVTLLANGIEAGVDVDDHMRAVGEALAASDGVVDDARWDDVHARITADSALLQAR